MGCLCGFDETHLVDREGDTFLVQDLSFWAMERDTHHHVPGALRAVDLLDGPDELVDSPENSYPVPALDRLRISNAILRCSSHVAHQGR